MFHTERTTPKSVKCIGVLTDAFSEAFVLSEDDVTSFHPESCEMPAAESTSAPRQDDNATDFPDAMVGDRPARMQKRRATEDSALGSVQSG